jgi:hypothetical protein
MVKLCVLLNKQSQTADKGWSSSFFREPEGKRPLKRVRHKWEDSIRMDLREIGLEVVDWINLAGSCEQSNEPLGSIKVR